MIIVNGKIITWENPNRILEGQAIRIEGGKIVEIGDQETILEQNQMEETMDAKGQYVMPGNICAHTHFYGAFSRGMAIPGSAPADFPEILEKLWWPLDKALDLESVKYSALVCIVDAIKHGTTTLLDHHASPNAIEGSLDVIADAVEMAGIRASLCYEVTDRNGSEGAIKGIEENVRFIERIQSGNHLDGRLAASFGLHASLTVGDKTLKACREALPAGYGFHIHVAEHSIDEYDSLAKYGLRVIDRLEKLDCLGPNSLIVHGVHLDPKEMDILAQTNTWVSHQPRSNMNNAVGLPQVEGMLRLGIPVCLGNDGFSNTMWDEWKAAYLSHKLWNHDPRRMNGGIVAEMAAYNNASLASQMFAARKIGTIQAGAVADIIFVDYQPFTELTSGNLPWHILFGFNESMVTMTMVAGKILMKNRVLETLDEVVISEKAMSLSRDVWKRYNRYFN